MKQFISDLISKRLFLFFALALFLACDAPRENPFDPGAENYQNPVTSKITVWNLYVPRSGIQGVTLIEKDMQLVDITSQDGSVIWQHEERDSLRIIASADGYFTDTLVFYPTGQNNTFNIFLNGKPELLSSKFSSLFSGNQTYIYMETTLEDPDGQGDIDDVVLQSDFYQFDTTLKYNGPAGNLYETSLHISDISPVLTPEQLPELTFNLIVKNKENNRSRKQRIFSNYRIIRVIQKSLKVLTPEWDATVSDSLIFSWEPVNLNYDFTYTIKIYRSQPDFDLVKSITGIPSDQTRKEYSTLVPGFYFWQLEVSDAFGNRSQSQFYPFTYVGS